MKNTETAEPKDWVVTRSNALIESRYCLSVMEQRIVAFAISKLSPDDEDFPPCRFKASEIAALVSDGKPSSFYERIDKAAKGLLGLKSAIQEPDGTLWVNWFTAVKYYNGTGEVDVRFSPELRPYLLQLKERFTSHNLECIVRLQSRYSVRIYELLKQYEDVGKRRFELDDLRDKLALKKTQHARWQEFRRNVLEPAIKELSEKTDLQVSYKTRKKGRRIWFIDFVIKPNDDKKLGKKEIDLLKGEASKCLARNPGCTTKFSTHKDNLKIACHWCARFKTQRAEAAGQIRLPIAD